MKPWLVFLLLPCVASLTLALFVRADDAAAVGFAVSLLVFAVVCGALSAALLAMRIDKDMGTRIVAGLLLTPVLAVLAVALTYPGCALMMSSTR
jgi:hypothetical protein